MQLWCALPLIDTVTALPRSPRGLDDHAVWGLPKGLGWRSSQAPMTCWLTGGGGLDLNQRPLGYEGISAPETKQAQPRIAETARDSAARPQDDPTPLRPSSYTQGTQGRRP